MCDVSAATAATPVHPAMMLVASEAARPRGDHGGDDRNRTCDPLLAKQPLYQLSYVPMMLFLARVCVNAPR